MSLDDKESLGTRGAKRARSSNCQCVVASFHCKYVYITRMFADGHEADLNKSALYNS